MVLKMGVTIVGVIEIVAGIVVLKKAEIGGYIVAAWLTVIAFTLLKVSYQADGRLFSLKAAFGGPN